MLPHHASQPRQSPIRPTTPGPINFLCIPNLGLHIPQIPHSHTRFIRLLLHRVTHLGINLRARLAINRRVFEGFDELEEDHGEDGARHGADPVDPLVGGEADDDARAEGACWIEGAACPENTWGHQHSFVTTKRAGERRRTSQLGHKKREANANRRDEIPRVLLSRQHEDRKHQRHRQQHLDDNTLRMCRRSAERRADVQAAGKERGDDGCSGNGGDDLRDEEEDGAHERDGADEVHADCHCRIYISSLARGIK